MCAQIIHVILDSTRKLYWDFLKLDLSENIQKRIPVIFSLTNIRTYTYIIIDSDRWCFKSRHSADFPKNGNTIEITII